MRARIYPLALGKILHHSILNLQQEVAGLLIGKAMPEVVEVWDAITGSQKGSPAFVKLDEWVMALVAEVLTENLPELYIIGWYHSHPGLNIFMSPIDIETQRAYQAMFPKAVALVIDPLEYSKTGKISDVKLGVFRLNKDGKAVPVRFTIGLQRQRVLESTLIGLHTMSLIPKDHDEGAKAEEIRTFGEQNGSFFRIFNRAKRFLIKQCDDETGRSPGDA